MRWPAGMLLACGGFPFSEVPAHPAMNRMTVNTKNLTVFFTVDVA